MIAYCPDCGAKYELPDERKGIKFRCKKCSGTVCTDDLRRVECFKPFGDLPETAAPKKDAPVAPPPAPAKPAPATFAPALEKLSLDSYDSKSLDALEDDLFDFSDTGELRADLAREAVAEVTAQKTAQRPAPVQKPAPKAQEKEPPVQEEEKPVPEAAPELEDDDFFGEELAAPAEAEAFVEEPAPAPVAAVEDDEELAEDEDDLISFDEDEEPLDLAVAEEELEEQADEIVVEDEIEAEEFSALEEEPAPAPAPVVAADDEDELAEDEDDLLSFNEEEEEPLALAVDEEELAEEEIAEEEVYSEELSAFEEEPAPAPVAAVEDEDEEELAEDEDDLLSFDEEEPTLDEFEGSNELDALEPLPESGGEPEVFELPGTVELSEPETFELAGETGDLLAADEDGLLIGDEADGSAAAGIAEINSAQTQRITPAAPVAVKPGQKIVHDDNDLDFLTDDDDDLPVAEIVDIHAVFPRHQRELGGVCESCNARYRLPAHYSDRRKLRCAVCAGKVLLGAAAEEFLRAAAEREAQEVAETAAATRMETPQSAGADDLLEVGGEAGLCEELDISAGEALEAEEVADSASAPEAAMELDLGEIGDDFTDDEVELDIAVEDDDISFEDEPEAAELAEVEAEQVVAEEQAPVGLRNSERPQRSAPRQEVQEAEDDDEDLFDFGEATGLANVVTGSDSSLFSAINTDSARGKKKGEDGEEEEDDLIDW